MNPDAIQAIRIGSTLVLKERGAPSRWTVIRATNGTDSYGRRLVLQNQTAAADRWYLTEGSLSRSEWTPERTR